MHVPFSHPQKQCSFFSSLAHPQVLRSQLDMMDPCSTSVSMYNCNTAHQLKTCCRAILPLYTWNRNTPWLTFQLQCSTIFPPFTEHKLNSHFPEAVQNSFLLISYTHSSTHCPRQLASTTNEAKTNHHQLNHP